MSALPDGTDGNEFEREGAELPAVPDGPGGGLVVPSREQMELMLVGANDVESLVDLEKAVVARSGSVGRCSVQESDWSEALEAARRLTRVLVPSSEVEDIVGTVMCDLVEFVARHRAHSLVACARTICRRRAIDSRRRLRRGRIERLCGDMLDAASSGSVDEVQVKGCRPREFRGPLQRLIADVVIAGGSLDDARRATGLPPRPFRKVVARMLADPGNGRFRGPLSD